MVFNSVTFLVFFFLFFSVYWLGISRLSIPFRNLFIAIASYVFYGWWDWRFLLLLFFSTTADFFIGLTIHNLTTARGRKIVLMLSILVNIGLLSFFKYFNFFTDEMMQLLGTFNIHPGWTFVKIILPVGISFYTFQSLSYTILIYRREIIPTRNFISFAAYVSFFPQLVAGPIERAKTFLPQFFEKKVFNYSRAVEGFRLILFGLFKKVVIADNLSPVVNDIFDPHKSFSSVTILIGSLLFAFQIYCDFSGYSDIAIGTARSIGFDLMKNFTTPYFSSSFTEFWHRWHISLSTWFRDFVYIPLGGSHVSKHRTDLNLLITFFLSGIWHGGKLTFAIWGILHGTALILEKHLGQIMRLKKWLSCTFVFILVTLFWIPFRADGIYHFIHLTKEISACSFSSLELTILATQYFSSTKILLLGILFLCFLFAEGKIQINDFNQFIHSRKRVWRFGIYYFLVLSILLLSNLDVKPFFIYFQF